MPRKLHPASRIIALAALVASLLVLSSPLRAEEDVWPALKQATFGDRNPNFRFTFGRGWDNELDVAIVDTDGAVFTAKSQANGS